MTERNPLQPGRVRRFRDARRWSQQELASVAGLSRPEISAIETGRVVPSVKVALALGRALGVSVEALFGSDGAGIEWAWAPRKFPSRVWLATVGARRLAFPCESGGLADWAHDAVVDGERLPEALSTPATLVVAGCDPAASLLQACLRERGIRTLVLVRSSSRALALLKAGLVHVAGVHLSGPGASGNRRAVRERIGGGYRLARWAIWETGIATTPALGLGSLDAQRLRRLSWVGREEGSGARRCMDALFRGGRAPRCDLVANDHREVAQTIRLGAADAGVCLRVSADEAGLDFLRVRSEPYDLCYRAAAPLDPAVETLLDVLGDRSLRSLLGELPGYDAGTCGQLENVE